MMESVRILSQMAYDARKNGQVSLANQLDNLFYLVQREVTQEIEKARREVLTIHAHKDSGNEL